MKSADRCRSSRDDQNTQIRFEKTTNTVQIQCVFHFWPFSNFDSLTHSVFSEVIFKSQIHPHHCHHHHHHDHHHDHHHHRHRHHHHHHHQLHPHHHHQLQRPPHHHYQVALGLLTSSFSLGRLIFTHPPFITPVRATVTSACDHHV